MVAGAQADGLEVAVLVQGRTPPSASGWGAAEAWCYLETPLVWWALQAGLAPGGCLRVPNRWAPWEGPSPLCGQHGDGSAGSIAWGSHKNPFSHSVFRTPVSLHSLTPASCCCRPQKTDFHEGSYCC